MTSAAYLVCCGILTAGILAGIALLSKPTTARIGNGLSAMCSVLAIFLNLYYYKLLGDPLIWACIAAGLVVGVIIAAKVKMIQMPQMVALLNGLGGAASMFIAVVSLSEGTSGFSAYAAGLALAVGAVTLTGSLVAGGKLARLLPQKPVVLPGHKILTAIFLVLCILGVVFIRTSPVWILLLVAALIFGVLFSVRVGGADMPITISLLNSLSGVAGGIAGIAVRDPLLTAAGGIVGASGLILTQIMCRAMNRKLSSIILASAPAAKKAEPEPEAQPEPEPEQTPVELAPLKDAKKVIIVPGYGMALAQAQMKVKQLADKLEKNGAEVKYAIHPVAGRMPGHMNVLLCEADVPYDQLCELDDINEEFKDADVAILIGANDTVNPAANPAEGTPIYGMPVLKAEEAKQIIVCNFDLKPGYAGVENPIYSSPKARLLLGDAKDSIDILLGELE